MIRKCYLVLFAIPILAAANNLEVRLQMGEKQIRVVGVEDGNPLVEVDGEKVVVNDPVFAFSNRSAKKRDAYCEVTIAESGVLKENDSFAARVSGNLLTNLDLSDAWLFAVFEGKKGQQQYAMHDLGAISGGKTIDFVIAASLKEKPKSNKPALYLYSEHRQVDEKGPEHTQRYSFAKPATRTQVAGPGRDTAPQVVDWVQPEFPQSLVGEYEVGTVAIQFKVGEDGKPSQYKVSATTHEDFAKAVVHALDQCRFEPATKDGEVVASMMSKTFHFESK